MTLNQLQRLCKVWQKRLRLQDWNVTISFAEGNEIPDDEVGHIDYEDEEIWAKIKLVHLDDDRQLEENLVHELLHLRLDEWPGDYHSLPKERAINLLANCFIQAYPRRVKKPVPQG